MYTNGSLWEAKHVLMCVCVCVWEAAGTISARIQMFDFPTVSTTSRHPNFKTFAISTHSTSESGRARQPEPVSGRLWAESEWVSQISNLPARFFCDFASEQIKSDRIAHLSGRKEVMQQVGGDAASSSAQQSGVSLCSCSFSR